MRERFGVITLFLVFVISFCVRGTVMSQEENARAEENSYYRSLEKNYRDQIGETLSKSGLEGSGVTLTWVREESGCRTYKVSIHNRSFRKMDETGRKNLRRQLSRYEFSPESCSFVYELSC